MKSLQMWGGIESTLNRVNDQYIGQYEKSGHNHRPGDLEEIKNLGIKKIRYSFHWELVAPKDLDHCHWQPVDKKVQELKDLNLDFIASFLHHGSGPQYTSLIDPDFPKKFSIYARLFARRYPWVTDYTPINEINTTARFSCLYGHWYPHLKSDLYYLKAVIHQCKATILAMKEIRRINPKARLIQTEDVGRCQSTDELQYQCHFENERRWLAFDLLCGKVTSQHPLYAYIIKQGISESELSWFESHTCPPTIVGINHYHLSNRFLDHRLDLYPEWTHGGNGIDLYADVGAVDSGQAEIIGPEEIMLDAWKRYEIPLAITECHARGEREGQMRWLNQVWKAAQKLNHEGIPVEAVTAWSLLGTYDWHNLCTSCENFYEPGVFDLRPHHRPQATGLSKLVHELATTGHSVNPILNSEGVWQTPRRILWGAKVGEFTRLYHRSDSRPILITGGATPLGQALARICGARNIHYKILKRKDMDITDHDSIEHAFEIHKPWAVINAAAYLKIDNNCGNDTISWARKLAVICKNNHISLLNFSSTSHDLNNNVPGPFNVYEKKEIENEELVLKLNPNTLIIRTSSFFGPWDENNFVTQALDQLIQNKVDHRIDETYVSPTYLPDFVNECLNLLIDGEKGIVHLANSGSVTLQDFTVTLANVAKDRVKIHPSLIQSLRHNQASSTHLKKHTSKLPPLEDAMIRYLSHLQPQQELRS